jgi:HPt (histidine-containing phosphotransfer) domain-containing protein
MKCSAAEFEDYCASRKEPTWAQLDRLVTLIVNEQQARIEKNRQFLRAARRKPGTEP